MGEFTKWIISHGGIQLCLLWFFSLLSQQCLVSDEEVMFHGLPMSKDRTLTSSGTVEVVMAKSRGIVRVISQIIHLFVIGLQADVYVVNNPATEVL